MKAQNRWKKIKASVAMSAAFSKAKRKASISQRLSVVRSDSMASKLAALSEEQGQSNSPMSSSLLGQEPESPVSSVRASPLSAPGAPLTPVAEVRDLPLPGAAVGDSALVSTPNTAQMYRETIGDPTSTDVAGDGVDQLLVDTKF